MSPSIPEIIEIINQIRHTRIITDPFPDDYNGQNMGLFRIFRSENQPGKYVTYMQGYNKAYSEIMEGFRSLESKHE